MKIIIKKANLNEAKRKIDKKLRKIFKYDEKFLNSLIKPGKETFIRFSDEMPGGGLVLTPNISQYVHSHTPSAIYGYPLSLVREKLIAQKLDMSHYKYVIVYWVDSSSIVNLGSITKVDLTDLVEQIISYGGKEKYLEALNNWVKKAAANHRDKDKFLASSLISSDGSVTNIDNGEAAKVFWNVVANYGNTSTGKTLLLNKLHLKQKNAQGETVEKNFSTILDTKSIIDPVSVTSGGTGSSIQGLTLSSKYIDSYEIYDNPAETRIKKPSQKQLDKSRLPYTNAHLFDKAMKVYLEQVKSVSATLKKNVKIKQVTNGIEIEFKLPGSKSLIDEFVAKDPKIKKNKLIENASYAIVDHLNAVNGSRAYGPRISWKDDFYNPGLKTSSSGDTYSITIEYPPILIEAQQVYSILYFAYFVYAKEKNDMYDNPFSYSGDYKNLIKRSVSQSK